MPQHAEESDSAAGGSPPRRRLRTILTVGVGLLLLALLLRHAGLDAIWERLATLGWWAPLILLPYAVVTIVDGLGWRCALPASARALVPLPSLCLVRMAGEAVNSVTPTAAVGGEPVKAYLLRRWNVSGADAVASVVIAKTALTGSQALFTAIGVAAMLEFFGRRGLAMAWLVTLLVLSLGFIVLLVWVQRRGPAAAVWRLLRRLAPRARFVARLESGMQALDLRLAEFYRFERRTFVYASLWNLLGWVLGVVEVQVMLTLLGYPVPWLDALVIESMSQPIRATAIVIPGGIGTQEVGGVWLCGLLGIPEPEAVTLWLLKRGREVVFDGIGLVYLARATAATRRLKPA